MQEPYLNDLRKRRQSVVIYLVTGIKQVGVIESFDRHALSLRQGASTILVYKHMIASVMPAAKALTVKAQEPAAEREPRQPQQSPRQPQQAAAPVIIRKAARRTF